ncbi:hypothetical protein TNCV_1488421 [Trichonephila clavipes]|nr:hypothetical protein TNCV_1488421 [Trichonephila clavipes]
MCIKLKNDIPVCQRARRLSCSDNPSPMKTKQRREKKISKRSTKEEFIKKDVLMPDGSDKNQHSKINDSVHPSVLSSSQNHAMPVKHNVFLWNFPDVEEMPSHDGETV